MTRALALPLLLAIGSVHAGMPEGAEPVLAAPLVAGRPAKDPVLLWREHGHWAADAATWEQLGVVLGDREQGVLTDAALGVSVHYAPETATVSLDIPAQRQLQQVLGGGRRANAPVVAPAIGGVLVNYNLASQRSASGQATSAALDVRSGGRWGVVSSTGQINDSPTGFEMQRGVTTWQKDDVARQLSYEVGDVYVTSQPSTAAIGGVRFAKDPAALDPLTPTWPVPMLGGLALDAGTVSVLANQAEVSRSNVQAGPFSVDGRYLAQGFNQASVVVRDAYGRETVVSTQSLYIAPTLLRTGLSRWEVVAGRVREDENRYGTTGASASGAWGLTDLWTLHSGGQVDAAGHRHATLGSTAGLGRWGVLDGEIGRSSDGGRRWLATYDYRGTRINVRLQRERNDDFWRLKREDAATIVARTQASVVYRPSTVLAVRLTCSAIDTDSSSTTLATLGTSLDLRQKGQLSTYLTRDIDDDDLALSASYTYRFGSRASLRATARHAPGQDAYGLRASYRTDSGVRLALDSQDGEQGAQSRATADANTRWGDAHASVYSYDGYTVAAASFSGALHVDGGGVTFARPVSGSYALADVPGQAGVTVRLNGAAVGITNAQGRILLPDVSGLIPVTISLKDKDLPVGVEIGDTSRQLTVQREAGARVTFPVRTRNARSFILSNPDLAPGAPLSTASEHGVVGYDGAIYLEFPQPGQVVTVPGVCRAVLPSPLPDVESVARVDCR